MQAFNAADFVPVNHLDSRTVQQRGHADEAGNSIGASVTVAQLETAAATWAIRERNPRDVFAFGKAATCLDMAAKLARFGSFASDKQAAFAEKLVLWSLPRQAARAAQEGPAAPPVATTPAPTALPRLHELMQRLSKLTIGTLTIARKNQDSLCWVKVANAEGVMGKIENGTLLLFWGRLHTAKVDAKAVEAELLRIEADPQAAAALHGKASGRCSVCSRDLTDPDSIAIGIGPICLAKF